MEFKIIMTPTGVYLVKIDPMNDRVQQCFCLWLDEGAMTHASGGMAESFAEFTGFDLEYWNTLPTM